MKSAPPIPLTFEQLAKLEPRLSQLEAQAVQLAREWGNRNRQARLRLFYQLIKPKMVELVGNFRRQVHPVLSGSHAYCCTYDRLAGLLKL